MKKSVVFLIAFLATQILQAQNYIPLKIDSLYSYYWALTFELDTVVIENFWGYSYDANDSLIQLRYPTQRFNYTYAPDTTYLLTENLTNNTWSTNSRTKTAFLNGKRISQITQSYENNTWTNGSLLSYTYNADQQEAQYLQQLWSNNAWLDFYKKESTYNTAGQKIEEAEYYNNTSSNGNWEYNREQRYKYDNAGHQTEVIFINSSVTGPYFTGRTNWNYGNDNLVDTIQNCNYNYPNDGICTPSSRTIYNYTTPGQAENTTYLWQNFFWSRNGKEVIYDGPGIYGSRPDSILHYRYLAFDQTYRLSSRRYFQYQELPDGTIYFREEWYSYSTEPISWKLIHLKEEWYHMANPVGINTPSDSDKNAGTFPNPCRPGTPLNISVGTADEILIFDELGRLVASQTATDSNVMQAPMKQGVYTLVLMKNGKLVGRAKQVVME